MHTWMRPLVGLVLGGGAGAVAYVLLSPSVWTRDDLSLLVTGSAFAAGICVRVACSAPRGTTRRGHIPTWVLHTMAMALCLAAANVVILVLGGLVFGKDTLGSLDQVVVFAVASAVVVTFVIGTSRRWGWGRAAYEAQRETRIAELRAQARRDLDELVAEARNAAADANRENSSGPTS